MIGVSDDDSQLAARGGPGHFAGFPPDQRRTVNVVVGNGVRSGRRRIKSAQGDARQTQRQQYKGIVARSVGVGVAAGSAAPWLLVLPC